MEVLTGKTLGHRLKVACDGAATRLWIASPYVGSWESVRRLIGRTWWDNTRIEVRLLTDSQEGNLNGATVQRLAQRGSVHDLRGLHAKLYIIDDSVLLTSANLTGTAFSKRYEAGIWLTGSRASTIIKLFETWWDKHSARLAPELFAQITSKRQGNAGEGSGNALSNLCSLPPDPGDFGGHQLVGLFGDYDAFLIDYRTVTDEYLTTVSRIWPSLPVYFEIDGWLNYLFRDHPKRPSKRFEQYPPRTLTEARRREEIRRSAGQFHAAMQGNDGQWRPDHSRLVRRLLSRRNIRAITRPQIREVASALNCMNDGRQKSRFLSRKNSTARIRAAWTELLYGTQPVTERMGICAGRLYSFKRSSVRAPRLLLT